MNNSSYKFYNIDEMDRLFLRHKLPKLTQEEMEKLKIIISIKGIKFIVTDLLTKKTPCSDASTDKFYQTSKK